MFSVPRFLKKYKPDLFLSPDGFIPLKTSIPSLAVIHDINFFHLSENLPFFVRKFYLKYFPLYAEQSTRIATVSEYSKSDIVKSYTINPDKIDVVYNGSDPVFVPLPLDEQKQVKNEFSDGKDFFVFIGSLLPRKNLCRMLEAFDIFKEKYGLSHKLIIIGDKMFRYCHAHETHAKMKFKDDVIFSGRIPREEIRKVLASSRALLFVPSFEGFGIPILEAFRCEVPVISGDKTSLPEVGGDAVLYTDPFSVKDIAEAMMKIEEDKSLREELVKKGKLRKDHFTWEKTAQKLWDCIERTVPDKI
jgi:glycosyltransferase involved in cell wall biosynthesis